MVFQFYTIIYQILERCASMKNIYMYTHNCSQGALWVLRYSADTMTDTINVCTKGVNGMHINVLGCTITGEW